jgi:hypothetical protein
MGPAPITATVWFFAMLCSDVRFERDRAVAGVPERFFDRLTEWGGNDVEGRTQTEGDAQIDDTFE